VTAPELSSQPLSGPDEQWTGKANMVGSLNEFLPESISS
jgi:hypothetical protein